MLYLLRPAARALEQGALTLSRAELLDTPRHRVVSRQKGREPLLEHLELALQGSFLEP